MALTIGTPTSSGNQANSSSFSFNNTPDANTKALVVVVSGVDASATDSVVSGITFGGVALESARARYKPNGAFFHIWYLKNPTIAVGSVAVTMGGACTDVQATAIPLVSAAADTVVYDTGLENGDADTTHGFTITSVVTGAMGIAAIWNDDALTTDVAPTSTPTSGTLVTGSEADNGASCNEVAWLGESGGSVAFSWTKVATNQSYAQGVTFYEIITTVTLTDPTAGETVTDTTPDLTFNGTSTDKATTNNIEYQLQVDTATTFNSQASGESQDTFGGSALLEGGTGAENNQAVGQTMNPSSSFSITSIEWGVWKNGSPVDNLFVEIHTASETGTLLGTSSNVAGGDVSTSSGTKETFTFSPSIDLFAGTTYYFVLQRSGANDTINRYRPTYSTTSTYAGGVFRTRDANICTDDALGVRDAQFITHGVIPLISSLSTDALGDFEVGHPWDDAEVVTYTVQSALAATTHYWRVRGKDTTYGIWGAWSTGAGSGYESFVVSVSGDKSVNVFDSINVSESVTPQLVSNASVFDSITVAETIQAQMVLNISVFDTINVSESVTPQLNNLINVFDSTTVAENIVSQVPDVFASVVDNVTVSESTTPELVNNASVVDNITVAESVSTQLNHNIDIFDSITVTEDIVALIPSGNANVFDNVTVAETTVLSQTLNIDVFDSIQVSEAVTVIEANLVAFVSDNIAVSESTISQLVNNASVVDNITVAETTTPQLVNNIDVNDLITVTENITIIEANFVANVFDGVNVSEDIQPQLVNNVNVFDSVTIAESTTAELATTVTDLNVNVFDSITVADNIQTQLVSNVSVFDDVSISESVQTQKVSNASVVDDITVSENIQTQMVNNVSVIDNITVAETTTPQLVSNINVNDLVNVSESITAIIPSGNASIVDNVTVSESTTAQIPSGNADVFDSVTVSESVSVIEANLIIDVFDNITVSEDLTVLQVSPGAINVLDDVVVSESVTVLIPTLHINVFDSTEVSESLSLDESIATPVSAGFKHLPNRLSRLGRMSH